MKVVELLRGIGKGWVCGGENVVSCSVESGEVWNWTWMESSSSLDIVEFDSVSKSVH